MILLHIKVPSHFAKSTLRGLVDISSIISVIEELPICKVESFNLGLVSQSNVVLRLS